MPTHGKDFALLGSRPTYPGGETDYLDFEASIRNWPRGLQQTEQIFLFTSCYLYTTYADPQVCVDPFPSSSDRKICKPRTITYSSGQGSPVAITKIEQENTPQAIHFTIHLQNKGKGRVYNPMSLHKCDPYNNERVTERDLNLVILGDIRTANGGPEQLRCQPDRLIRLDSNGKGIIVCQLPIRYEVRSAYLTPLILSFWYGYSDTIQKTVLIKRGN